MRGGGQAKPVFRLEDGGVYMAHSTPVDDCLHPVASLPQATIFRAHLPSFPLCAEADLRFISESRSGLGRAPKAIPGLNVGACAWALSGKGL